MPVPAEAPRSAAAERRYRLCVLLLAGLLFGFGVYIAPIVYMRFDIYCWVHWAYASGGRHPWDVYRITSGPHQANYPPLYPYWVTVVEAIRKALPLPPLNPISITLFKLPSLIACTAGSLLIRREMPADTVEERRRGWLAALCWLLSAPMYINAALWGQSDALLGLGMALSVLALARGRCDRSALYFGLATGLKVQTLVLAPVMVVYLVRVFGWRSAVRWLAFAALTFGALALPMVIAGQGRAVLASFQGVGFFTWRTMNAYNLWSIADYVGVQLLHLPEKRVLFDTVPVIGPLTSRGIGLLAFGGVALGLLLSLWRRPGRERLPLVAGLFLFAFFALNTEMHERYSLPAVALLACAAPISRRNAALFAGICATATLNQIVVLYDRIQDIDVTQFAAASATDSSAAAAMGAVNLLLLFWGASLLRQPDESADAPGNPAPE